MRPKDIAQKALAVVVAPLAKAIVAAAIQWLKDPDNRDELTEVGKAITAATPWTWDDKLLSSAADLLTAASSHVVRNFPFLGGR